jgi:hypothetical protein
MTGSEPSHTVISIFHDKTVRSNLRHMGLSLLTGVAVVCTKV